MTPLRQRMLEDLQIRNYSPSTVKSYVRSVAEFAKYFKRSPDQLGSEEIRSWQLYLLRDKGVAISSYIQSVCGLRFFYTNTLNRKIEIERIPLPRYEKKLPVILSKEEVKALLEAPRNLGHRAMLATMYGGGLARCSEVSNLKVCDIDGARKVIWIRGGKGNRMAKSCPRLHYVRCSPLTFAGNGPPTGSSLARNRTVLLRVIPFSRPVERQHGQPVSRNRFIRTLSATIYPSGLCLVRIGRLQVGAGFEAAQRRGSGYRET